MQTRTTEQKECHQYFFRSWGHWGQEAVVHLVLHIQTESCCRQCKGLDPGRCSSLGCRSSYQRSGHGGHGAGGCEASQRRDKTHLHKTGATLHRDFNLTYFDTLPKQPLRATGFVFNVCITWMCPSPHPVHWVEHGSRLWAESQRPCIPQEPSHMCADSPYLPAPLGCGSNLKDQRRGMAWQGISEVTRSTRDSGQYLHV